MSGSIGYGIQFDYSDTYVMVRRCYVHDHFGGSSVASGTDGIHFYRTKDFWAVENTVARVGAGLLKLISPPIIFIRISCISFEKTASFFKNASIVLRFEGRELSDDEIKTFTDSLVK